MLGFYRDRVELTGGGPLSPPEASLPERLKRLGLAWSLRAELAELERRAAIARAAGAGQASGPEELGP